MKNESLDFSRPSQIVDDVSYLYQSIYEGSKKVDQDGDGDKDFADVMIARMVASGVPKEVAIAKVRGKSYNEEFEINEEAKRLFKKERGSKNEEEYMAGRSDAGKRISGNERVGPRYYKLGRSLGGGPDAPTRPGQRPENTPKVTKGELNYARMRYKDVSGKSWNRFGGPKGLPEEFQLWINALLDEGYDLSEYSLDEMYEIYEESDEEHKRNERRARVAELTASGRVMTSSKRASTKRRQSAEEQRQERLERLAQQVINSTRGASGRVSEKPMGSEAPAPKAPAPEANRRLPVGMKKDVLGASAAQAIKDTKAGKKSPLEAAADEVLKNLHKEDFDLYDLLTDYLIDEGYVEDYESADTMIEYMSDEWLDEIVESKKWIQKAIKKPGALSKQLGVPEEENIPLKKLRGASKKGGKLGKRARLAMTLRKFK